MIRAKNYNLTAIILIAVSISIAAFAAIQFTSNNMRQSGAANSKLAQLGKDKKPKLKPAKQNTPQVATLLVPSETQQDDLPVVHKSGTLTEDETWSAGYVYVIDNDVTIPDGLTLNLAAGVIVKYNGSSSIEVNEGGTLNANGTSSDPIIFTSQYDDSVGGDSNGDGNSTSPSIGNYNLAVYNNGQATITYAMFDYSSIAIAGGAGANTTLSVADSQFKNSYSAIDQRANTVALERNQFDVVPGIYGRAVNLDGVQDISTILLSGVDENLFAGNSTAKLIRLYRSVLPASKTLAAAASSGATIWAADTRINGQLSIENNVQLFLSGGSLDVSGSLNLAAGAIVKYSGSNSITVNDGGVLNAVGTTTNPVMFTSQYDDSVGSDVNGDGNSTNPSIGDYGNAIFAIVGSNVNIEYAKILYANIGYTLYGNGQTEMSDTMIQHVNTAFVSYAGEANLTGMLISDASTGVQVGSGSVVFRGTINDISNTGIHACNWGTQNCSVDASYTDWGNAGGPNTSSQTLVCGQVTIAPWVYNGNTVNGGLFGSGNCDNSPTPDQNLSSATQNFSTHMSNKGIDCSNGFQDACDAMETAQRCLGAAVDLAGSTSPFPLPGSNPYDAPASWGGTLANGATTYIQAIESPSPQLGALQFGNSLLGALNTITSVADAYNTCAP